MKRQSILLIIALVALCVIFSIALCACEDVHHSHTYENGVCTVCGREMDDASKSLAFTLNEDKQSYSVTGIGTVTATNIVIPASYNNKPVTSIGAEAFRGCSQLTSITIPDSVTSIGEYSFWSCYRLIEVYNKSKLNIVSGSEDYGYIGYFAKNVYTTEGGSKLTTDQNGFVIYDGNTLVYYIGKEIEITIPNTITIINQYAFNGFSELISVTIPESVTSIGDYAFEDCYRLVEVCNKSKLNIEAKTYENGAVGAYAKNIYTNEGESKLTIDENDFVIYDGNTLVNYIGKETKITIPNTITVINDSAFKGFSGLTSVTIGDSVTDIERESFYECSGLKSVIIPNGVRNIGAVAFYGCSGLTSVSIPDSVISIGVNAFEDCANLNYNEYDNAIYLGNKNNPYVVLVRRKNNNIISCTINENTKVISNSAFSSCEKLANITIPEGVIGIGSYAFFSCGSLTNISIPDSVITIGSSAFFNSYLHYNEYDNALYLGNKNNPYVVLVEAKSFSNPSCIINDNTKVIYDSAFESYYTLTSITIPDSVTSIGSYAFRDCERLTSVIIGNGVTSIESFTFDDCSKLTSITIGSSVTNIGNYAFTGCSGLSGITIPDSVTNIGYNAFYDCYRLVEVCNKSKLNIVAGSTSCGKVGYYAKNVYTNEGGSKLTTDENGFVIYDGDTLVNYLGEETEITIPNTITIINDFAFYDYIGRISVTIGEGVTSIGNEAFSDCDGLRSIIIPDSVTSIGDRAFRSCGALTSVTIGNGVDIIGNEAFYDCDGLGSIIIPDSVTRMGNEAFCNCDGLRSVTIGNGVTSMGNSVFGLCEQLASVTIRDGATIIGDMAFELCDELTLIIIPDSVMSIGDWAFRLCDGITTVCYKGSAEDMAKITIGSGNSEFENARKYYYSENEPALNSDSTAYVGDYWHYDDNNEIVVWKKDFYLTEYLEYKLNDDEQSYTVTGIGIVNTASIVIPSIYNGKPVTSIGDSAFYGCSELMSITIGSGVTSIGDNAFYGCSGLTSVSIPGSVTSIGDRAFEGCNWLRRVTIGDNLTDVGFNAFKGCSSLFYNEYDNALYLGNENNPYIVLVKAKNYSITSCIINNDTKIICREAFDGCQSLESVTMPDGVIKIGDGSFWNCKNLTAVYYKGSAEDMAKIIICSGNSAFEKAKKYYYSENEPALNSDSTDYDGNYWHYNVNNEIVVWKKEN